MERHFKRGVTLIVMLSVVVALVGGIFAFRPVVEGVKVENASETPSAPAFNSQEAVSLATLALPHTKLAPAANESIVAPNAPLAAASTANYTFSTAVNASLVDMSTGTTQLVAASQDDTASSLQTLPFDFFFMGVRYSQFSVSSNGGLYLDAVIPTTGYGTTFPVAGQATIAPFWGSWAPTLRVRCTIRCWEAHRIERLWWNG